MSYCVYAIVDPRCDEIFYVGHTCNLGRRREEHLAGTDSLSGLKVRRIRENGFVPHFVRLETCADETAALLAEVFWIELLKSRGVRLANAQAYAGYRARAQAKAEAGRELKAMRTARLKALADGKPARETRAWSRSDIARLKGMARARMDLTAMADALARSPAAVGAKLDELGLR